MERNRTQGQRRRLESPAGQQVDPGSTVGLIVSSGPP
jgi:hypothetical protein